MGFHFGSVSTQGSEHTIDAKKSPMELQLVHYDSSLLTPALAKASTNADALVVVSFLFEVSNTFIDASDIFH
jgi:carbonic anhydrase